MTCAELDQRAVDYLYGELVPAERAAVEAHLATCEACRHEVRGLERTLGVTREALRGPLAQEAPSQVRLALQQEAARVAAQAVARTAARSATSAAKTSADAGESFWAWLRRPWFLPAVAAFSVVTLFFLAKPAILERPKHALDEVEMEARQKATQGEDQGVLPAVPAANSPAPEPAAGAPAEDKAEGSAPEPERRRIARERMNERGPEKKGDVAKVSVPTPRASAPRTAASRWATPPPATMPRPAPPTAALEQAASAKKSRADDDTSAGRGEGSVATGAASGGGAPADVGSLRGRAGAPAAPAGKPAASKPKSVADDPVDGLVLGGPVANATAPPPAAAPSRPARRPPASPPAAARQPAPASPPAAAPASAPRAPRDAVESVMESAASKEEREADSESTVVRELSLPELRKRADLAFQQSRWDRAIRDYRELLRRFGTHADAPLWRRRLDISTQSAGR
jgi:hypothetical protein